MSYFTPHFWWACGYLSIAGLKSTHVGDKFRDLRRHRAHYDVTVIPSTRTVPLLTRPTVQFHLHAGCSVPGERGHTMFLCLSIFLRILCQNNSRPLVGILHDTVHSILQHMMTSSNGNIFRVTGPLCGEFTGHRWIPLTKASDAELWRFPLWSASV